jgi:tetratricopeptide (TPR) repeat protein
MGGIMGEKTEQGASARYRAFISYSHADARFAAWLHRKLEAWSLPGQDRLSPIFIDRAELAAGSDLSSQVRGALADSAALIVVASPAARSSSWVAKEVALFRELHPDRPVLAALLDGEPGEAFPDPLLVHRGQAIEPLAADFRDGHDGKRLALIKIVAGLTAQPLDRLIQRDAQSRQHRVMAITAGALLLSLILAAMLVVALRARAEAEHQRAEAEGMVEFMLTDLRDKLKGVGSPTIMAAVNERALKYYSQQDLDNLPDASLDRRARVLHAMGEDDEHLGRFPAALKKYKEAWRITGAVLARHPQDPDAIFAHAQSEYWVGEAAWQQGDLATTEGHWRAYLAQAEALARVEPGTKRSLMELGYANGNLCELTAKRSTDIKAALNICDKAAEHMRAAIRTDPHGPEATLALANRLGWEADLFIRSAKPGEAIRLRQEEGRLIDGLQASDPQNAQYGERRLWPKIGIGRALLESGKANEAMAVFSGCFDEYQMLVERNPDDIVLLTQLMRTAWLLTRSAEVAGSPKVPSYLAATLKIHSRLKGRLPPNQMIRFDTMIEQLTTGGKDG